MKRKLLCTPILSSWFIFQQNVFLHPMHIEDMPDMEKIDPAVIMNIIHSGESLTVNEEVNLPTLTKCSRCSYVSSQTVCKACVLLEGLNRGLPKLGIGKSSKAKKMIAEQDKQKYECTKDKVTGDSTKCLCKNNVIENRTNDVTW